MKIEESADFAYAALLSFAKKLRVKMGQPGIKEIEYKEENKYGLLDCWRLSKRAFFYLYHFLGPIIGFALVDRKWIIGVLGLIYAAQSSRKTNRRLNRKRLLKK